MARIKLTFALAFFVLGIALVPLAVPLSAQGGLDVSVYLPFATTRRAGPTPPPGAGRIHGRVTIAGQPADGITLTLRAYDDLAEEIVTEVTVIDGDYVFNAPPPLPSGKSYFVRFGPNDWDPSLVFSWYGPDITAYVAGQDVAGGDFDLENIELISPGFDEVVPAPTTFSWLKRQVPSTYRVEIFDPIGPDEWTTDDLGDVDEALVDLPVGAERGKEYGWLVWAYAGETSYGQSYYYYPFTYEAAARNARRPVR